MPPRPKEVAEKIDHTNFADRLVAEMDDGVRPPRFYDDGSFSLETHGCSCCSINIVHDRFQLGYDLAEHLVKGLTPEDKKRVQVAWVKVHMKALGVSLADLK